MALTSFNVDGVVTCEGLPGVSGGSGGGAGGSLQIYAALLTGNGTLRASGGSGNFLGGQMSGGGAFFPLTYPLCFLLSGSNGVLSSHVPHAIP